MGKRHRRSKADRPATRRYVANVVRRARDEVIRAVLFATASTPDAALAELETEDWRKVGDLADAFVMSQGRTGPN